MQQGAIRVLGISTTLAASSILATTYTASNTGEARSYLQNAGTGDTVLLAPGTYDDLEIDGKTGVTLRSADPANPAIIAPTGGDTPGLYIGHPMNITVQDLVIDFTQTTTVGYAINVDAGSQSTYGSGLTLRNVYAKMTPTKPTDGFHISGVQGFLIENCRVQNWGTSDQGIDIVGAYDGMIRNTFLWGSTDTDGGGIQLKGGARDIVVRANRLLHAGCNAINFGGSTDLQYFQPGINFEAKDLTAEGNLVVGSNTPIAFNSSIGCTFRYNVSYSSQRWLGRILYEAPPTSGQGFPTQVTGGHYVNNRLIWADGALSRYEYINTTAPGTYSDFTFANNQWYNRTWTPNSTPFFPDGITETGGIYGVDPHIDPDKIIPWTFNWGTWLINTSLDTNAISTTGLSPEQLYLAIPGNGAMFDPSQDQPLTGAWTYQPVTGDLTLTPMTDAILIRESMVPEPAMALLVVPFLLATRRRRTT